MMGDDMSDDGWWHKW